MDRPYCGTRQLQPPYTRYGTNYECLRKGVGVGKNLQLKKSDIIFICMIITLIFMILNIFLVIIIFIRYYYKKNKKDDDESFIS